MDITSYLLGKKNGGGGSEPTGEISITSNGTHNVKSYATASVNVPTGITPTGTINITENGTSDVTNYASANVNVQPDLETKSVTITENTTTTITPTTGKDGLSSVQVTTNVSGGSVETITDLNDTILNFVTNLVNIPNTYETLTQNNVTLYTPATNCVKYFIFKNTNDKYKVCWSFDPQNSKWGLIKKIVSNSVYVTPCDFRYNTGLTFTYYTSGTRYYSTSNYDTIEECITAIKSSTTTYTQSSSDNYYRLKDKNSIILSNAYCIDDETKEPMLLQKISSNETIEVIS